MPKLPIYDSPMADRGLQPSSLGVNAAEQEGEAWDRAFHQIGAAAQNVGNAIEHHNELEDATNLAQKSADFEIQQEQAKKAAMANGTSPMDWYQNSYLPSLDQFQTKMSPNSEVGQKQIEVWAARHKSSTFQSAAGDQSTLDAANAKTGVEDSTTKFANLAATNPEKTGEYAGQSGFNVENLARAGQIPPDKVAELKRWSRQTIYDNAVKGIVARAESPNTTPDQIETAKTLLKGDEWVSNTSPGTYVAAMDSLDKAKTQQINIQGNIAALALTDINKQIAITGDLDMYQKGVGLIANIQDKSPAATAMKQAEERKKLDEAFAAGRVTSGVMTAPAADLDKAVQDFDTRYKAETDPQKLGVYGSQRTAIDNALKRRDAELKQDASKYSLNYSKTVKQTYLDFQNAAPQDKAAAFDRYAQTSAAFQQMVNPGKTANVLTDDMRTQARQAVSALRTPGGPAQAGSALYGMAQTYGRYWPQVTEQLRREKVFSGDEGVAARLYGNPGSQALGETILNASAATGAERFGMHMVTNEKAMALAVPALAPLAKSLGNTGAAGADFMNSYTNALAHAVQYTGVVDANGVKVYASKMALDQFSFPKAVPTLRISNDLHIDADRVADGALAVQHGIASHQLVVPPSYSGLNTKDQTENYAKQIAATGKWYTNENGTGALLYDEDGHNVQEYAGIPKFDTTKATGLLKQGNLDPWNRPVLHNPGGGYSTTSSASANFEGKEVLFPTVVNGKRLTMAQAIQHYRDTGENLGTFDTPEHADTYAQALHNAQATMYDRGTGNRRRVDVELKWEDLGQVADKQPARATFKAAAGILDHALKKAVP